MKKFTFVLEWKGGTYLSQFEGDSLNGAIEIWSNEIDVSTIGASYEAKQKFIKDLESEQATPIEGLTSVWCISQSIGDSLALVHIIETIK